VLATADGRHFRGVATLPVPVRYPAVAGAGTRIWVFGGQRRSGLTDAVQQVSLATGKAAVVGHLPDPVTGAAAFVLGGRVYVAGGQVLPRGRHGLHTSGDVLAFDPQHDAVAPAGRLPVPVANAAAAVLAGTAYLVGGNNGLRQVPAVTELRPAARAIGGAGPGGPALASGPWPGPAHGRGHLPGGMIITADIENCRLLLLVPPSHRPRRVIGRTGVCAHDPPHLLTSPNGAFPATSGKYLVTEINGDWVSEIGLDGHLLWSTHPPGVAYPSDTVEVYPGRYLTTDYSSAGRVVEFDSRGRLLWRFRGLDHPSLALPLPNGDILVNDDYNDRVIVIDPITHRIVWQYGHTGRPGSAPGLLDDSDGVDLTPPNSMLISHAATMGRP
jgi:hypothetical protein